MKKRFYKYFPWLFVLGDILTVSFSFFISNKVFQPFEEFKGLDFPTFPAFIMIWMVITILKEDFKIGRTNEADQTFKKLIGSLAWFLVIISMIWMPFHDNSLRLLSFLSLAASLLVFLGICLTVGALGCKNMSVGVGVVHHSQYGDISLNIRNQI